MSRLAFMTFALQVAPAGDPRVAGFENRIADTFAAAESSAGFIARSTVTDWVDGAPEADQDFGAWGPYRRTAFYPEPSEGEDIEASTLSLWQDIESVYAFAYSGRHLEALQRRAEWFQPRQWPTYVAWWVDDDEYPSWSDAADRLEHLHEHGPSRHAFDFHHPFSPDGAPLPRPTLARS